MGVKVLVFGLILLQACGQLLAQTPPPAQPDSPGILQRLADKAREAKTKVQDFGRPVLGYIGAYYEDHIEPVTGTYVQWAANVKNSVWENIQTTIDRYKQRGNGTGTDQTI